MKRYKKVQIIKHALQHYIKRPETAEQDLKQETALLEEYEEEVKQLKEKYKIE